MTKVVLMDVDNTLLDFDKGSEQSMQAACGEFGVAFEEWMFDKFKFMNGVLWRQVERGELTVPRLFEIRWNRIFADIGVEGVDGIEFEKVFHKYLAASAIPIDGAAAALKYLSAKYTVCVTSNAPAAQQQFRMQKAGLKKYIRKFFISEEIGASKPSERFFDIVFGELGVSPDEAIIVGDSPSADIQGAAKYGIKTVYFNYAHSNEPVLADFYIDRLEELKSIL